jgi:hypothetical protein
MSRLSLRTGSARDCRSPAQPRCRFTLRQRGIYSEERPMSAPRFSGEAVE